MFGGESWSAEKGLTSENAWRVLGRWSRIDSWQSETGYNSSSTSDFCLSSSDCASGYRCGGNQTCVQVVSSDGTEESTAGDESSPTTVGGCELGGGGSLPGGSSSACGSSAGGGGIGCGKASCSDTGNDGLNDRNAEDCCGSECCRAVVGGGVSCRCGPCNDEGKPCSSFCDSFQSANGVSYGGGCLALACSECTDCNGSFCVAKSSAPCHCNPNVCGGCAQCDSLSGSCIEVPGSNCQKCIGKNSTTCASGASIGDLQGCGRSSAAALSQLSLNQAINCAQEDNERAKDSQTNASDYNPDFPTFDELDDEGEVIGDGSGDGSAGDILGGGGYPCNVVIYKTSPSCPAGYTCASYGFIRNEDTGETEYLVQQCKKREPVPGQDYEGAPDTIGDGWPELPGDPGPRWEEMEWDGFPGTGTCGETYSCRPGRICGAPGVGCIDDPAFPVVDGCGGEGVTQCPDGICCGGGNTCHQVPNEDRYLCCRNGAVQTWRNLAVYPCGASFQFTSYNGPSTLSLSGFCDPANCKEFSFGTGSGLHVPRNADNAKTCGSDCGPQSGGCNRQLLQVTNASPDGADGIMTFLDDICYGDSRCAGGIPTVVDSWIFSARCF